MKILLGYVLTYVYLIGVLWVSNILKAKFSLSEETSRKGVHVLVGFSYFIMVYFFGTSFHLVIPPLTFIIINYLSYKRNIVSSMERENKESKGTIYYAVSFAILSFITVLKNDFLPFYAIGVLTMTIGDGFAPFIGKKFNRFKILNTSKTYFGSLFIMMSAFTITFIISDVYSLSDNFLSLILIGVSASVLEFLGFKGIDNLILPIGVSLISYLLLG